MVFLYDIQQWLKSNILVFFKLGFTQCKAEEPLQGMKLQEKEVESTKRLKHIGNLFRKNLQLIDVC